MSKYITVKSNFIEMQAIKSFLGLSTLIFTFGLFSCGEDVLEDSPSTSTPTNSNSKRITHINSEDYYNISFEYSGDKLSSYVWKYVDSGYDDYEFNQVITQDGNKVIIKGEADSHDYVQTYTLNEDGYAISCTAQEIDGKTIEAAFEYSGAGYLTKAIIIEESDYGNWSNTCTFTYSEDGDILRVEESSLSGHIFAQEYGNTENKSKIMDYAMSQLLFDYQAAFYYGILGKPCTHLPSSSKQKEIYESDWSHTDNFIYTLDEDGYVSKTITASSSGNSEILTYTYSE